QLGECLHVLRGHKERVTGLARLDRERLISSSVDRLFIIWDIQTGERLHTIELPSPILCLGAADGYIVLGLMDGRVLAWEAKDAGKAPSQILSCDAHRGAVRTLYFPVKDVLLTGGGDGLVKFWDLKNGGPAVGNRYNVGGRSVVHTFKVCQA
ncbi:unnamed protein product, partial [Discosporangium mesarthrocarpum]